MFALIFRTFFSLVLIFLIMYTANISIQRKMNRDVGFSHLSQIPREAFAELMIDLIPSLCEQLEAIISHFEVSFLIIILLNSSRDLARILDPLKFSITL